MLIDYSKNSVPYHQKRSGYATDHESVMPVVYHYVAICAHTE